MFYIPSNSTEDNFFLAQTPIQNQCKEEQRKRTLPPSSRVHIPTSTHLQPTSLLVSLARQDTGQIVFIHEIPFFALSASLLCRGPDILLLIWRKDKLISPSTFASAAFPFPAGAARRGLRDAEAVAAVVPLHVLFEVHGELAVSVCGAGDARESIFSTAGAELLAHVFGAEEAGVAAFDEGFEVADSLQGTGGK